MDYIIYCDYNESNYILYVWLIIMNNNFYVLEIFTHQKIFV